MAMTAGYVGNQAGLGVDYAKRVPIKETPRTALARSMKYLHEAVSASRKLREELCGSWSEEDQSDRITGSPGFLSEVESAAADLDRMASEIVRNINAIQSRL